MGNALTEQTSTSFLSYTLSPIHFSSSVAHALQDAWSLFNDISNVKGDCQDLVHLQDDGWIVGPNGKLLLWVPPSYHKIFLYTPWTHLVIPRGSPELDLSKMAHGPFGINATHLFKILIRYLRVLMIFPHLIMSIIQSFTGTVSFSLCHK